MCWFHLAFVVSLLQLISSAVITGNYRVLSHNLTTKWDPTYFVVNSEVRNQVEPNQIDFHVEVKNVTGQTLFVQVFIDSVLNHGVLQRFATGKSTDLCQFFANVKKGDLFLRIFFQMMNEYGNRLRMCPIEPMKFDVLNMEVKKFFPSFSPNGRYKATAVFSRLVVGKLKPAMVYYWFGEIIR